MNGISVVYLEGFTDSIYTVYTGDKPKPNVNSDAQIFPLPCWLLSLAWKPIKDKHQDLFLILWLCQHPKPVLQPLGRGAAAATAAGCRGRGSGQRQGRVGRGNPDGGVVVGQQQLESLEVFDILSR